MKFRFFFLSIFTFLILLSGCAGERKGGLPCVGAGTNRQLGFIDQILGRTNDRKGLPLECAGVAALIQSQGTRPLTATYPNTTAIVLTVGQQASISPANPIANATYTISPALPSGLSLSASTGVITGASTVVSPQTNYTIVQTPPGGTPNNLTLILTVTSSVTGGSGGSGTITISGTISGLTASGLVLQNNGANNQTISSGATTFTMSSQTSGTYAVTVQTQPTGLTCSVSNGSGSSTSNVTNVSISCSATSACASWTQRTVPNGNYQGLAFGAGLFVAPGNNSNQVITSPDGATWTSRTIGSTSFWSAITFGNSRFVIVSNGGATAFTSTDGINWTSQTAISLNSRGIAFGAGLFVTTSTGSANYMTSPDGVTWTSRSMPGGQAGSAGSSTIAFGNGVFMVMGSENNNTNYFTSTDGINWTLRTSPVTTGAAANVQFINGRFIMNTPYSVGMAANQIGTYFSTSTDGINWTTPVLQTSISNNTFYPVAFGNGGYCSVAAGNQSGSSSDALNWTYSTSVLPSVSTLSYRGLVFANNTFVAIAGGANGTVAATSP